MRAFGFLLRTFCTVTLMGATVPAIAADRGEFDVARWDNVLKSVRERAAAERVSPDVVDAARKNVSFVPSIIKSDRNQAEFKLTLDDYLSRTVSRTRIDNGHKKRAEYPSLLSRVQDAHGVPPHVILAFWGLESNYGAVKSRHRLVDAFVTLMYDGRREKFFGDQLMALLKIADKNNLDVANIQGSWAGAMGHFQFIPTTLAQYGMDGNGDGRIDIINNVSDAMFSAGNYLSKLGWNQNERIARRVVIPADFDLSLLDGKTKKNLVAWAEMGVTNPDGTPLPTADMTAGIVGDINAIAAARDANANIDTTNMDTDTPPHAVYTAYLAYPNFYRIKKWNSSNFYAIAIAELADRLKQ